MVKDERVEWKHNELVFHGKEKNHLIWDLWLIMLNVHILGKRRKAQFSCQHAVFSRLFSGK